MKCKLLGISAYFSIFLVLVSVSNIARTKEEITGASTDTGISAHYKRVYGDEYSKASAFAELPQDEIIEKLYPLIASVSIEKVAQVLGDLSIQKAYTVLKNMFENRQSPLSRNDKVEFMLALAKNYKDLQSKFQLFDLFAQVPHIAEGDPLLLVAARADYAQLAPTLINWARTYVNRHQHEKIPSAVVHPKWHAFKTAVKEDDVESLKLLSTSRVRTTHKEATNLLWLVIEGNHDSEFIPFLDKKKGNINAVRKGYTLLAKAVENQSLPLVRALVERKAQVNKFSRPEIGTPLQLAIEHEFTDIDMYLRAHGARE